MSRVRNDTGSTKSVGYCMHTPQHKRACPSPRSVDVPAGAVLTFDELAPNGITALCQQLGLTPIGG